MRTKNVLNWNGSRPGALLPTTVLAAHVPAARPYGEHCKDSQDEHCLSWYSLCLSSQQWLPMGQPQAWAKQQEVRRSTASQKHRTVVFQLSFRPRPCECSHCNTSHLLKQTIWVSLLTEERLFQWLFCSLLWTAQDGSAHCAYTHMPVTKEHNQTCPELYANQRKLRI